MALMFSTRNGRRRPSSRWSNTSKPTATNSSAWKLPRHRSKTSSSSSPEGDYGIEKLCHVDEHAHPPGFAEQNVFLFQHCDAVYFLFPVARRLCQGKPGRLFFLSGLRSSF